MSLRSRWRRVLALAALAAIVVAAIAWLWVIPALIVAGIREHHEGHVSIRGWWIGRSSAGVTGLTLRESPSAGSPAWATAERAVVDLSIGSILRGRFAPRTVTFVGPDVVIRIGEDGRPARLPLAKSKGKAAPTLIARRGRLTMAQAGRPELVVGALDGRLDPDPGGATFRAESGDAGWGKPVVAGRFGPDYRSVRLRLTADRLPADREKTARIPFVHPKVWDHFRPTGPVRVVVDYERPEAGSGPSTVRTVVDFERTRIVLPNLRLTAVEALGRLTYEARVVRLEGLRGDAVGGRVAVDGTMDFGGPASRYALTVAVGGADLATLPDFWGIGTIGLLGRLTGSSRLEMVLSEVGLDLTGSSGAGEVEEASIRGIPLGRLGVKLRGEGLRPAGEVVDRHRGVFSPQWLGSDFEVRDVELRRAIARVGPGGRLGEVPVSGRLGLRLRLRMPLGTLDDLKGYDGRGTADLSAATIGGIRLGRLAGRVNLAGGVLDVADVRGRLVDRPEADADPAPDAGAVDPPPATGPLPAGGFRGHFRADLAAGGEAGAGFEGNLLPLAALAPSAAGTLSVRATARAGSPSDPRSWSGSGTVEGPEVGYRSTRFRDVSAGLTLEAGRLGISGLAAKLAGLPLAARGEVDLAAPHAFRAGLDASGLPLADLLALARSTAGAGGVSGTVTARAEAGGTLSPWRFESRGGARVDRAEVARVPLGVVPIAWETRGEDVVVTAREVQRYGGHLSAEARVPARGGRPIEGTVKLSRVDTARLSAEVPGSIRLTGLADGAGHFRIPMPGGGPGIEAEASLTSAAMTVEGIPARALRAKLAVRDGVPRFEAHAEGLSGTFAVKGAGSSGHPPGRPGIEADLSGVGFRLRPLWEALDRTGPVARIDGLAAISARVRSPGPAGGIRASGSAEVRGLKSGENYPLGHLLAGFAITPDCWRLGNLDGELWDGQVRGDFWRKSNGRGPARYGLDLRLDRASLPRILAFAPVFRGRVQGLASFEARGDSAGSFRGEGEFRLDQGRFNQLPVTGVSIPVDWDLRPEEGFQGTIRVRKARARVAGGRIAAEATLRFGDRRDLHAEMTLGQVDLRAISLAARRAGRPIPGRIDGVVAVDSRDLDRWEDYTGEVNLSLTGAALLDIPILEGLDDALGSARGAVFDEGAMHARLAHRAIRVDQLTLVGPLAQVHTTGTIGLDGKLDLVAIVNTSNILPANGQIAIGSLANVARSVRMEGQAVERMADFLSPRLMKFRVSGTLAHPSYAVDGSIQVDKIALAFFLDAMKAAGARAFR